MASRWKQWYGIDFSPLVAAARHQDHATLHRASEIGGWTTLADPNRLLSLDLRVAHPGDVSTTHTVTVSRSGVLSDILVYCVLDLEASVPFSTHPSKVSAESCWAGNVWLPGDPIAVEAG